MDRVCRTWVVETGSGIAAYLSVQDAREAPEGRVISVPEIGGSRIAILAAVPLLLERYDAEHVEIRCLHADLEMRALAAQLGLATTPSGFHGTARVMDPAAAGSILTGLARCVLPARQAAALSFAPDATGLAIGLAGEEHRVEGFEDLTALLFGSSEQACSPSRGRADPRTPYGNPAGPPRGLRAELHLTEHPVDVPDRPLVVPGPDAVRRPGGEELGLRGLGRVRRFVR